MSFEIQTSPAPRGLITKEPFKGPAEVEVTNPSSQMDLDQDIQVINPKDKNISPEESHKWRHPELPPVPKGYPAPFKLLLRVQKLTYLLLLHHELISSSEEVHGARKDRGTSKGLDTPVVQRTSPTDEILVEKPELVIRGPEEEIGPRKGKQPSGSSPRLQKQKSASKSAKQAQESPKYQPEGKSKGKWKGKSQMEQLLREELQDSQEREDIHGQCVHYGKSSDGIKKQGRGKIERIFSEEVDLVNLVNQIETCNKEIITMVKTFEHIQQKVGNEILQVKESQKTIIGLENVDKDNILSLGQIFARGESRVTLLNQPDDHSISVLTRQLKELRRQVQSLENSTGHNVGVFKEPLEKCDKSRLELKEDIQ
ncbi:hypothetical protein O181_078771 [Austropuccinia psidii MF-1]|uniref:Uncharacterized protein n=1 Tax=Austropuccinia psidii MF-1 TaxID=1389203 RepID=A0A9Q3FEX8_9BASI|nr:hypothetical protein [Austropuccinia psidii MF-1]